METHKQKIACERQLASKRVKGKVPLVVTSLNARSTTNKQTELNKTRLLQTWIDIGKVELSNDPKLTQSQERDLHCTWPLLLRVYVTQY